MVHDRNMEVPQFTNLQRAFLVREFHRTNSVNHVLRRFREVYPNVRCPSSMTVYRNVRKYDANGTNHNLNPGRSGRRRSGRSVENINAVRHLFQNHPDGTISSRRNELGLPSATFNRITRLDLNFHPYQMIKHHELRPGDRQRRLQFCQCLLDQPDRFIEDLLIGDEAGLNGST